VVAASIIIGLALFGKSGLFIFALGHFDADIVIHPFTKIRKIIDGKIVG
jgi:hypothetical protein